MKPEDLSLALPYVIKLIKGFNIPVITSDGYEADDIIGTLSREGDNSEAEVIVISGDKDLTQLATANTTVRITRKGITDTEKYTPEHIIEKYGIEASQLVDMMGLMGDPSDNIPGVPGVGEKTALKLLIEYGTIENVYKSLDKITAKKLNENLTTYEDQAYMSRDLATIVIDAPVTISIADLTYAGPNIENLTDIYKELKFNTLLEKIAPGASAEPQEDIEVTILQEIKSEHLTTNMAMHIEMMDENYLRADILGIALADENRTLFIPLHVAEDSELFKEWLADGNNKKASTDSKAALASMNHYGFKVRGFDFDLLLGAYIVSPSTSVTDVASITRQLGYTDVQLDEAVYGKGAKKAVASEEIVAEHASRKALAIWKLRPIVEEKLKESNLFDLYHDLELPLALILGKMESTGVKVDKNALAEIGTQLSVKIKDLETTIHEMAGEKFNVNSPKQLGVILFEKMGLTPIKKTKTGYSTAADVLEKLESEHEIISHLISYRQLAKLNSTYIVGLLKEIHEDGKIHTRFQQALTQTGRLSSVNPNLQNIPVRLEEGRKIRKAFVPSEEGWLLFAADYSQIELRVLAHMSQDEKLMEAFHKGEDIHSKTASDVFGVAIDEVTSDMRDAAKAVNFGIVYGISDYGLSQNLNITRKEAAEFISTYLTSFPGVKRYMDEAISVAKVNGYVTTLMKRRRYLPEITSSNFNLRSFAERTAMNTPIQGSAADIIKQAMIDMTKRLDAEGMKSRMLLQVHDELIFEAPENEIEKLKAIVPEVMEAAIALDVPLKVDSSFGKSWYDME